MFPLQAFTLNALPPMRSVYVLVLTRHEGWEGFVVKGEMVAPLNVAVILAIEAPQTLIVSVPCGSVSLPGIPEYETVGAGL
jgi:hypothetical protein